MMVIVRTKTAAFWEGWQCVQTHQPCRFTREQDQERLDWAKGFEAAVTAGRASKPFWQSKTMIVGATLLTFGMVVWLTGHASGPTGNGFMSSGFGQGVSLSSLLMIFLRTITNENINISGGQYTPPPTFGGAP